VTQLSARHKTTPGLTTWSFPQECDG